MPCRSLIISFVTRAFLEKKETVDQDPPHSSFSKGLSDVLVIYALIPYLFSTVS